MWRRRRRRAWLEGARLVLRYGAGALPHHNPTFEQHFEVWAPNPHEAHAAIPVPLRQLLVMGGFHGIVERHPGALCITSFDVTTFDPANLSSMSAIARSA